MEIMEVKHVNPDLQAERNAATFNTNEVTYLLDGGQEMTKRRREVQKEALTDGQVVGRTPFSFLTRPELFSEATRKLVHFIQLTRAEKFDSPLESLWYFACMFPNEASTNNLHNGMFVPTLENQSTPEQYDQWVDRARNYEIIGTYAQTEMGHGTNLRGLETTATYDREREEFVLHSPTLSSIKWWPGGLGKTCNHAIVMASLITGGKNHGMHPFVMQLRSLEDHSVLPGIKVGDIGPKFGFNTVDNGYLKLENVRVPRMNLLMKNAVVEPDGTYKRTAKSSKAAYGTMIYVRSFIVLDVTRHLAQACTIAVRYSCVRRQSELQPGGLEPKILDFQTQQYKLLPVIAAAYAYWFSGLYTRAAYFEVNDEIQKGNLDLLPELHALSSGLKAFSTNGVMQGIEQCRLACGGHGFSQASGFPKLYTNASAACTYEGENTVLYLQLAKFLMKCYTMSEKGGKLVRSVAYLSEGDIDKCVITSSLSPATFIAAYKHRAARMVRKAGRRVLQLQAAGKAYHEAWNMSSVLFIKAAEAHSHCFVVQKFADVIASLSDEGAKKVLDQLFLLYACYGVVTNAVDFLEDGFMSEEQLDLVRDAMMESMNEMRPNAVALVDAFDFTDNMLGSVLGRYDGNVYENMFNWAKDSPLNKTQVHESYYKYLKPIITGKANL